jgi:hypothetical protein
MGTAPDIDRWIAFEERIAALLPGTPHHDRKRLLAEIGDYATAAVQTARKSHEASELSPSIASDRWLYSPVFICGSHRSGTTLLQQLLDGHRGLIVLPSEGTYFKSFPYVARVNPTSQDLNRFAAEWLSRFIDPNAKPHFKLGRTSSSGNPGVFFCQRLFAWQAAIAQQERALASFSSLLALIAAYRDVAHPGGLLRMWAEKTPLNEFHVPRLAQFADAKFIHLVRDPLASVSSLRAIYARHRLGRFSAARQASTIARSLDAAHLYSRRLKGRYLVVRYEDLTADPDAEMKRVCEFLQLEPAQSSLVPSVGGIPAASNTSFSGSPPGIIHPPSQPEPLDPRDSLVVRALVAQAAKAHRYALDPVKPLTRWRIRLLRR